MAHFYVVAQYVSPVLAWGFLGTDEELKQVCEYFKVMALVIFSLYSQTSLMDIFHLSVLSGENRYELMQ